MNSVLAAFLGFIAGVIAAYWSIGWIVNRNPAKVQALLDHALRVGKK